MQLKHYNYYPYNNSPKSLFLYNYIIYEGSKHGYVMTINIFYKTFADVSRDKRYNHEIRCKLYTCIAYYLIYAIHEYVFSVPSIITFSI